MDCNNSSLISFGKLIEKLKDSKKVKEEFIKLAGFTDEDVEKIDQELLASKQKNEEPKVEEEDPVIIKKIDVITSTELSEKENEQKDQASEEEQILNSVITRLNEM